MKKTILAVFLLLGVLCAVGVSATTITTTYAGRGTFDMTTIMSDLPSDTFHGSSTGHLDATQNVRIGESAAWAGDGADIDRFGSFTAGGVLETTSRYLSSGVWYPAETGSNTWVESDATGNFGQNTHYDYNSGGVYEIDQWKKQRNMQIGATGNYELGYNNVDLRNNDFQFGFNAIGNIMGDLFVDTAFTYSEHGRADSFNTEWDFLYDGSLDQDTTARGNNGGTFTQVANAVTEHIWGNAQVW
jgi:hypothetical protein